MLFASYWQCSQSGEKAMNTEGVLVLKPFKSFKPLNDGNDEIMVRCFSISCFLYTIEKDRNSTIPAIIVHDNSIAMRFFIRDKTIYKKYNLKFNNTFVKKLVLQLPNVSDKSLHLLT
jgi:hypothetical protein